MKIFTPILAASLLCVGVQAANAAPVAKAPTQRAHAPMLKLPAGMASSDLPDYESIIWDQPDGELSWLSSNSDSFTVEGYEVSHDYVYGSAVRMVDAGNGEVYLNHLIAGYYTESWVKATREGDVLTITGPQAVNIDYNEDYEELTVYLVPMEIQMIDETQATYVAAADMTYTFTIGADGKLTNTDSTRLLGLCSVVDPEADEAEFYWGGYGERDMTLTPVTATPLELPDGLTAESWVWRGLDAYYDMTTRFVDVAVDGNDIYVSGLCPSLPQSWVKGQIEGDKVTFASQQYLGIDEGNMTLAYFYGIDLTLDEYGDVEEATLTETATFDYEAETKVLSGGSYAINSNLEEPAPSYMFMNVSVAYQERDVNAAPADPYDVHLLEDTGMGTSVWCQIPNYDVDGNILNPANLYYEIFIDGEVMVLDPNDYYWDIVDEATTLIPYEAEGYDVYVAGEDHTVYIYQEVENSIGVRSVYINENGEALYSHISYDEALGIRNVSSPAAAVQSVEYYDLNGRRISRPTAGVAVAVTRYADGTVTTSKVLVK